MLLVLFALSAHAQPGYGSGYGGGTPAPFTGSSSAAPRFPSYEAQGPSIFALRQADRLVSINQADLNGNRVFLNFQDPDLAITGFTPFPGLGASFLADSAAQQERYFQNEIDYIRRKPVLTQEDRNKIDDFALQRDYAYNTKLRRGVSLIPVSALSTPGLLGPFSSVYDVKAKTLGVTLAQNKLTDARRAYQAEPSRANWIALQNAQAGVEQADYRQDASSFDLLGGEFGGEFSAFDQFGGVFRKKASETKLEIGLRNLRLAREQYAQDPSEDNWYALRLADLYVRATEEEDEANRNEVTANFLVRRYLAGGDFTEYTGDLLGYGWNAALGFKNNEDESRLWLRHARLEREQLERQRARALQSGASTVPAQLLGLSMYGPQQVF